MLRKKVSARTQPGHGHGRSIQVQDICPLARRRNQTVSVQEPYRRARESDRRKEHRDCNSERECLGRREGLCGRSPWCLARRLAGSTRSEIGFQDLRIRGEVDVREAL